MDNWYLLYSKPRQESRAQQHLANQGFDSFVPQITQRKLQAGKIIDKTDLLFPRYIFLKVNNTVNLGVIRSTRGVAGFVKFGDVIATVPTELITRLMQQQITMQQHAPAHPFTVGDVVTILDGPFAGLNAVFQQADGECRSFILLQFLGQTQQVLIDNNNLAQPR